VHFCGVASQASGRRVELFPRAVAKAAGGAVPFQNRLKLTVSR
jgi:hypothetical protein